MEYLFGNDENILPNAGALEQFFGKRKGLLVGEGADEGIQEQLRRDFFSTKTIPSTLSLGSTKKEAKTEASEAGAQGLAEAETRRHLNRAGVMRTAA